MAFDKKETNRTTTTPMPKRYLANLEGGSTHLKKMHLKDMVSKPNLEEGGWGSLIFSHKKVRLDDSLVQPVHHAPPGIIPISQVNLPHFVSKFVQLCSVGAVIASAEPPPTTHTTTVQSPPPTDYRNDSRDMGKHQEEDSVSRRHSIKC